MAIRLTHREFKTGDSTTSNLAIACFSQNHTSTTSQAVCYVLTIYFCNIYVYTYIVIIYLLTFFLFINALNKSCCLLRSSIWLHVIMSLFGALVYKITDHTDTVRDKLVQIKTSNLQPETFRTIQAKFDERVNNKTSSLNEHVLNIQLIQL